MRRIGAMVLAVMVGALALTGGTPAEAGGGCHSTVFTDEAKTTVELSKSCFSPAVVRVQAGDQVTWTNTDPDVHTVTGVANSWGSDEKIGPDQSVSYKFDKPGVFPYFCYLHPSMAGAVVVGDGRAVSSGTSVGVGVSAVSARGPGSDANPASRAPGASTHSRHGRAMSPGIGIEGLRAIGGLPAA